MPEGVKGQVMRSKRTYSVAFKRQVVEELLSGSATMGQLSRRYEISTGLNDRSSIILFLKRR